MVPLLMLPLYLHHLLLFLFTLFLKYFIRNIALPFPLLLSFCFLFSMFCVDVFYLSGLLLVFLSLLSSSICCISSLIHSLLHFLILLHCFFFSLYSSVCAALFDSSHFDLAVAFAWIVLWQSLLLISFFIYFFLF